MQYHLDLHTVRDTARGQWDAVVAHLAPEIADYVDHPNKHYPCPVHGGIDGFRVFRDFRETGGGICNSCGSFHDGFALLSWVRGWNFKETLQAIAQDLRITPGANAPIVMQSVKRPTPIPRRDGKRLWQEAAAVWNAALPLDHPAALVGRRYLVSRGLDPNRLIPIIGDWALRLHPSLPYYNGGRVCQGKFPALVSAVVDRQGQGVTVHRLYLAVDGGGKAPVDTPKKVMPAGRSLRGSAIRLGIPESVLNVAEGLETALSVMQEEGAPVWSCVSGTLLAGFIPPPGTRCVRIWADKDIACNPQDGLPVGEHYARQLATRLRAAGIATEIIVPGYKIPDGQKGLDWNDILLHKGIDGFAIRRTYAA